MNNTILNLYGSVLKSPLQLFSLLAILYVLLHGLFAIFMGAHLLPLYLPDDAYYYFQIAREFAETGRYSFDQGETVSSGFHVLWFYLLVGVFMLSPSANTAISVALILNWLLSLAAVSLLIKWIALIDKSLFLCLALFVSGFAFFNNQVSGIEWSLSVLVSLLIFHSYWFEAEARVLANRFLMLGLLGVLSRSDFLGLSVSFLAASLLVSLLSSNRNLLKNSVFLFIGSMIGLCAVFLHSYMITGDFIPTSAWVKSLWGELSGPNAVAPLAQFARTFLYIPSFPGGNLSLQIAIFAYLKLTFAILVSVLAIAFCIFGYLRRAKLFESFRSFVSSETKFSLLLLVSFMSIFGYLIVYSRSPLALQSWYTAQVALPFCFLLAAVFLSLQQLDSTKLKAFVSGALVIVISVNLGLAAIFSPTYPQGERQRDVGLLIGSALQSGEIEAKVGISDAGIAGYFSNGKVINTDGLVNHRLANYLPNNLICYLYDSHLEYMTGFGFVAETFGKNENWRQYTSPVKLESQDGKTLTILKIDRGKLEQVSSRCE